MINVNQKFIDSCNSDVVASQYKIKLSTNKVGTVLCTLNDDEFDISTGGIQRQASSGSACNIGGVCSTRLKITLNQKGIDKISNVDGFKKNYVLHLIQWNKVDDANQSTSNYSENLDHSENQTGKCDLGFYYISEIDNNYYNCSITAYDGMIAFERSFTITQLKYMRKNNKSIDGWLTYLCGLVTDENINISYVDSGINVNTGFTFSLSEDSSFDTIRDAISQLAMLKMAYATIDSNGNLTLKKGIQTNISTFADEIDNEYMFSCDNDVVESVVGYFYTSIAGFEYENTYTEQGGRNVINLYLAENKFLRGNEPYNGSGLSGNTLQCLRNMSAAIMGYSFFSCNCEVNARPYLELGDVIQVERKFVDNQGQVTIQQIPCVIDSVDNQIGATTHLTSNSTVSTNSSSSSKGMNSATPAVNSSPKEPSSSDVYNDIHEELTSPVTDYSDTTATVRIRLDDSNVTNFNSNSLFNNYKFSGDPEAVPWTNNTYRYYLPNEEVTEDNSRQILYNRTCAEYTLGKYFYNSNFYWTLINQFESKYRIRLLKNKSWLDSLIGLSIPDFFDGHELEVRITSVRARFQPKVSYVATGQTNIAGGLDSYIYNGSKVNSDDIYRDLNTQLGENESYNKTVRFEETPSSQGPSLPISNLNGYTIFSDVTYYELGGTGKHYVYHAINPYITNIKRFVKAYLLFGNIEIEGIVIADNGETEGGYVGEEHSTSFSGLFDGITSRSGETLEDFNTRLQNRATFINQFFNSLNKICDALINYKTFNLDSYILSVTYTTNNTYNPQPISDADKEAVDNDLVTSQDFEDLSSQVNANTQDIAELKEDLTNLDTKLSNDINNVNNDLQESKQTISTNTQNIATNAGNIANLDDRVDALENNAVQANPSENPTATLTRIKVNDVVYDVPTGGGGGGTTVIANPSGQAAADLEKLQVGNVIYGIPSGGGTSNDELVLTSEHAITLLGNNANTHMNYDKVLYQEGNNFINYDTTTGFWTVNEDTLLSVEMQSDISDSANLWLTYKIYECNSADITDIVGAMGQLYYNRTLGYIKYPIVKCRQGYYYFIAGVKANSGNWTITESNYDSTIGLYKLSNFARFVKKNGVYTPT